MKFSTQEEYGLRCLIILGKSYPNEKGLTIPDISQIEGISQHIVAKLEVGEQIVALGALTLYVSEPISASRVAGHDSALGASVEIQGYVVLCRP